LQRRELINENLCYGCHRIQEAAKQDDEKQLKQILSEVVAGYVSSDADTTSSNVVKLQLK